MFVSERKYQEEVMVVLQQGVDFDEADLQGNQLTGGKLKELDCGKLSMIAIEYGYSGWSWSGHYNPNSKTVPAKFYRPLYVNEEDNTFIRCQ